MISQEYLKELLYYNCKDGTFTAKVSRANLMEGKPAGYLHTSSGYWCICIDYIKYKAHRLAWLYCFGEWPSQIDHINRNKSDNRIENLRICNKSQNAINSKIRTDNTSGYRGVYFDKHNCKWRPYIDVNGQRKWFGRFTYIEDAIKVRNDAEFRFFGEFSKEAIDG